MARLFILIRRKGSKRFLGAIPTMKGATMAMASLRRTMPKQIKKGFVFRIVTEKQLKMVILKQRPRTTRRLTRRARRRTRGVKRRFRRKVRRSKRRKR